jgi:hypothetical protein
MESRETSIERAGRIFSERMKKYPLEIQVAMGITMQNVMKGCPWGITTSKNPEFMRALPNIKNSKNPVKAYKISGTQKGLHNEERYIMLVSQEMIVEILNKEAGGMLFDQADFNHAIQKRNNSIKELYDFLQKGKSGIIGIFNTNECNNIVVNGVNYPAFAVSLQDLFSYCATCGYGIYVAGRAISAKVASENLDKVYESLQVAPNGHALMIKVVKGR